MKLYDVWNNVKTKTCRYFLQKYLGQYLEENLNIEQLKIDLYNGKATVKNVSLNVDALNNLFDTQGWVVDVISGKFGTLTVSVPWNALMSNSSCIEIEDAIISVRPVQRQNNVASMLESMWSSASNSMKLAEECMKQSDENEEFEIDSKSIAGLEKFAELFDNILNRIKASFKNTTLRLEYPSFDNTKTIALCFHIDELIYENITGCENYPNESSQDAHNCQSTTLNDEDDTEANKIFMPIFAEHNISIRGLRVYTEEIKRDDTSSGKYDANFSKSSAIPILKIKHHLNIRLKMKQSEDINGPKIIIDSDIGSIYTLITPRQVHLILKLLEAFQNDNGEDEENAECLGARGVSESVIFQKRDKLVEIGNWMDSEAIPPNRDTLQYINLERWKDVPIRYSPPCSSMSSSTTITGLSKMQRKISSLEYCGEIISFSVHISSVVSIILTEDILVESLSNNQSPLNNTSVQSMINFSEQFFESIDQIDDNKIDSVALTAGKNHLFACFSPIVSEGSQHRIKQTILSKININAQKVDLHEVLNGKPTELITFDRTESSNKADVSINIKSDVNSTNVDITLQKSRIELDISIYDRLSALFAPSPYSTFSSNRTPSRRLNDTNKSILVTSLSSVSMDVKLRFPIYDARPIHDPDRVPWWQQNIRADYMLMTLDDVHMKIDAGVFEVKLNEVNVYYIDKEVTKTVRLLVANAERNHLNALDYVKISVAIPNESYWTNLKNNLSNENPYENIKRFSDKTPFSAKRICRLSDTIHNQSDDNMESETVLLPGETEELEEFRNATMRTSKIQVQVHVPNVVLSLPSKQFYEIIYNRFNMDLFMWEPSSPLLNSSNTLRTENTQNICDMASSPTNQYTNFNECDYSDNEESDPVACHNSVLNSISMTESIYFSIHNPSKSEEASRYVPDIKKSEFSIDISIMNGLLNITLPITDKETQIVEQDTGKMDIDVKKLRIFSVNGHNSDKNLCYLCIEASDITMDHCGLLSEYFSRLSIPLEQYMRRTLQKTPKGLSKGNQPKMKEREMLSLVIETKRVPEQRIKRLRVTTGLQQTTLRYHPFVSNQFWLNQLIDFLDVVDYPIEGYVPYGIITEMQISLWNCAVDYRPTNFDYRALVEFGAFTITSNVISSVNGCNLRFIIEDFILSIAPYKGIDDKTAINSKYLVPVLDIGLFDISLRLSENSDKHPKFDLRCSVHGAHLRTCSDSGKALAQLLEHLASDGGSAGSEQDDTDRTLQRSESASSNASSTEEFRRRESVSEHQEWQQERVNLMMADAIRQNVTLSTSPSTSKKAAECGVKPFYFPDEQQHISVDDEEYECGDDIIDVLPQVKSDLGDINIERKSSLQRRNPREDDYCIITEHEKQKVTKCGVRDVKICEDPIRIVDNHFTLTTSKLDLLKPPAGFPMPVSRYTLCEMTFTWHLYGGKDFAHGATDMNARNETSQYRMSDAYRHGVSYSKSNEKVYDASKPKDLSWKTIGGAQRNHEVLVEIQITKARLSHEVYPNHTAQASRQVLVVHDIEIRDRLQSSEINKFLFNPNLRTASVKTPQQMVVIKALHTRPKPKLSPAEECSLRVSLLPLRLHIDQNTLIFLADYFTNMGSNKEEQTEECNTLSEVQAPIMDVELCDDDDEFKARQLISTNLELLENEVTDKSQTQSEDLEKSAPIYFREVIFGPEVSIRFDYHGRKVELSRGPIAGLLMGLGQLQCSEIRLKKIVHRRGFLGIEKMLVYLCKEWLNDIKRNQLPRILKGVGPTYSLVQFIQGVIDLFRLPIVQYQRDGRIIRGLQLGAQSFTSRTAFAALELTSRVIQLLQFTAETAFDMLSSGPSVRRVRRLRQDKKKRSNRPKDMREGVTNAYLIVKEGINDSAATLIETAVTEHDQKGYTGAVGAVMRQIPQLVVCPAVLATQATSNILGGVKSSLVPEAKVEAREKWKTDIN
ncbi:unnamed protein product [Ceratitis capitata]|uniref:Autophagy-related protein 2 n=1 Tax=Ceratitis capitata TaxID=7213 RepID=A0A811UYR2_CERCA|nr:unnamed protein product [Ceratitis capitata]